MISGKTPAGNDGARRRLARLAGPMARRPLTFAIAALIVCAIAATGFSKFTVDSGEDLLVGKNSAANQTYARFTSHFGSDPLVIVFTAKNPQAFLFEQNVDRMAALEDDLAHDPRVASVIGPGTAALSAKTAADAKINELVVTYPTFIGAYAKQLAQNSGVTDATQLTAVGDKFRAGALIELLQDVPAAATAAHNARAQYPSPPPAGAKAVDSREKSAADAATAVLLKDTTFAQNFAIFATKSPSPDVNKVAVDLGGLIASYGDCSLGIATRIGLAAPSCQAFYTHIFYDLPNCPPVTATDKQCPLKSQWKGVLPPTVGNEADAIMTVRLKPDVAANEQSVQDLLTKIRGALANGIPDDTFTRQLLTQAPNTYNAYKGLGALAPTECGGLTAAQDASCHDATIPNTIVGASLLTFGVVHSMEDALKILLPIAGALMLILLLAIFRVRGRLWPLIAAGLATSAAVGISLWTSTPVTPAVLAGIPVLLGLGVDYAVQLVARFDEEARRGIDREAALAATLGYTGTATLLAALATLVGLIALGVITWIDAGPLSAVPLIAEFAFVVSGGVVLAWLMSVFVALPLAARFAGERPGQGAIESPPTPPATRTVALAGNAPVLVGLTMVLALIGWALLGRVPVQTDVQALVNPSLPELANIVAVQDKVGFSNELDVFVEGKVGAALADPNQQSAIAWECQASSDIQQRHGEQLGLVESIGDAVIGVTGSADTSAPKCVPDATPAPSGSPPSGSPSPTPAGGATPGAITPSAASTSTPSPQSRNNQGGATKASYVVAASPAPTPSTPPSPPPLATPAATAAAVPNPATPTTSAPQTQVLCNLRLFPGLSRALVMDIGLTPIVSTAPTQGEITACPAPNYLTQTLGADATPIDPQYSRIVLGVAALPSFANEAQLVDQIAAEVKSPPSALSLTATPTGLPVLATTAYDNVTGWHAYFLNLVPLGVVLLVLLAIHYRAPRRALLPVLPTAMAAGWVPLVLTVLGKFNSTLGSFSPLSVVLGALIVALGTEFGIVLLNRFYEERGRGLSPEDAAAAALAGVGRAIRVSAITLGGGFAVLAVSALFPSGLPLLGAFGVAVVINLGLAVLAVFAVMLPLAIAWEWRSPLRLAAVAVGTDTAPAGGATGSARSTAPASVAPESTPPMDIAPDDALPLPEPDTARPSAGRRGPSVSGRKRGAGDAAVPSPADDAPATADDAPGSGGDVRRGRPGVSGRRRTPMSSTDDSAPSTDSASEPAADQPPQRKRRRPPPSVRKQNPPDES